MKKLDQISAVAVAPFAWRIATRRIFLITLPLSLPLWLALLMILLIAFCIRALLRPFIAFWSAPPRRKSRSYGYDYGYGSRRTSRAKGSARIAEQDAA